MYIIYVGNVQVHHDKKRQEKSHTHYEWQNSALVIFCLFILYKNNKLALNLNLNWKFQNNMYNKICNRSEELF